jgi:hypothetical protein
MKNILIIAFALSSLIDCARKENNPIASLSLNHNSIQMEVGDSWLYRLTFINAGLHSKGLLPDTLAAYSFFQATSDTIMNSLEYLIIEGRDYNIEKDSISIIKKKFAIHFSDSFVSSYEFNTGMKESEYMSGVLKTSIIPATLTKSNFGTSILKRILMKKLLSAMNYDTSAFFDYVTPIRYPLKKDSIYVYRDSVDPRGNLNVRRKFLGIESVDVAAGTFEAYKFEFLTREYLGIDSIILVDWIGENGLVKRYFRSSNTLSDEDGRAIDSCTTYQIDEYAGSRDINPDTLIPWGRK